MHEMNKSYEGGLGQKQPDDIKFRETNDADSEPQIDDIELKARRLDDVELIDFRSEVEPEIIKQLAALKYGKEVDVRKLSPEEQGKVNVIVLMAMRMHEEDRNVTPENLAQVAVQEYFEGNNGSRPWILK